MVREREKKMERRSEKEVEKRCCKVKGQAGSREVRGEQMRNDAEVKEE